jgi:hypothetical protein
LESLKKQKENYERYQNYLHDRKVSNRHHHNLITMAANLHRLQQELKVSSLKKFELQRTLSSDMHRRNDLSTLIAISERDEEIWNQLTADREQYISSLSKKVTERDNCLTFLDFFGEKRAGTNCIIREFLLITVNKVNQLAAAASLPIRLRLSSSTVVLDTGICTSMSHASKGQLFMADILFRIVIIQTQPTSLRLLVLDESLDCLDPDNHKKLWTIINMSGIPTFVISHSRDVQAQIDSTITIEQTDRSRVEYGNRIIHVTSQLNRISEPKTKPAARGRLTLTADQQPAAAAVHQADQQPAAAAVHQADTLRRIDTNEVFNENKGYGFYRKGEEIWCSICDMTGKTFSEVRARNRHMSSVKHGKNISLTQK